MTRDEARRLLGGYATGSLTEAERAALMAAALDDQELFEELAGEQEIKEVLDLPGARERLLAALGTMDRRPAAAWWFRPWPWATAAGALAIAIMIVVMQRTPVAPTQEVAQVVKPAERAEPQVTAVAPAAPKPVVTAAPAPEALQKVEAPAPAAAPPPSVDAIAEERADKDQAKPLARQQVVGGVAAFAAGGRAENLAASVVGAFGFRYTVGADAILEIIPTSAGFLSVTAGTSVLYPSANVAARATIRVSIPAEAASLSIGFYAIPGAAATAVRRAELTGLVTDQDPPNGRIAIELSLKPGTQ